MTDANRVTIATVALSAKVRDLPGACDRPTDDLDPPAAGVELYGCRATDARIMATVGLQPAACDVLLRSLAVAAAHRGRGLAAQLLAVAEERAAASGCARIHLLTTSAVAYFANGGYKYGQRDDAPAAVRATGQFTDICPATTRYMTKAVTGKPT